MPRTTKFQHSFNAGEISPRMFGRTDVQKYESGAEVLKNFSILPEGALERRSGFRHVAEADATSSRLKEFVFSDDQAYVLEFGNQKIRFYRNESLLVQADLLDILSASEISSVTSEFSVIGHGYVDGAGPVQISTSGTLPPPLLAATDYYIRLPETYSYATTDVSTVNNTFTVAAGHEYYDQMGPFQIVSTGDIPTGLSPETDYYIVYQTATTFSLSTSPGGSIINITSVGSGTHTISPTDAYKRDKFRLATTATGIPVDLTGPGDGLQDIIPTTPAPIEIATPYSAAQAQDLQFAQSADVVYIVHPSFHPQKLSRFSTQGFFLEEVDFIDGPYLDQNTTSTTFSLSAATGKNVTLTSSVAMFKGSDIGRHVRIYGGASPPGEHWGWGEILSVDALQFADSDIENHLFADVDVTTGAAGYITIVNHGIDTGELVTLTELGTLPPGLAEGDYYVRADTVNRLGFFSTRGDAFANTNRIDPLAGAVGVPCGRVCTSVIDITAHGFSGGEGPVQLTNTGGGLPAGLAAATDYYIGYVDPDSLYLSLSRGGVPVGISDASGGGTHFIEGNLTPSPTCKINIRSEMPSTYATPTTEWRIGAWSNDPEIGFPRAISFQEQRLWFAGNPDGPQTIYASKSADFETFSPSGEITTEKLDLDSNIGPDNAITVTVGGNEINVIRWLSPSRTLIAGTSARIWNIQPASDSAGYEPGNVEVQPGGTTGASSVQPAIVENQPVFLNVTGLKASSAGYSIDSDSYVGEDLTLIAEHILRPGGKQLSFAADPNPTVYVTRTDGQVASLIVLRSQQVAGWSRIAAGGSYVASYGRSFTTTDVDTTADTITDTAHGISTGQSIRLKAGTTLPAPLLENKDYFVRAIDADTIALYSTAADANADTNRIDLTSVGVGTSTFGTVAMPEILSAVSIPAPTGDPSSSGRANIPHDQLWILVKRTLNGSDYTSVEFMEDRFETNDLVEDAFMVDCGATYTGSATTTITGLSHLNGEYVDVLADGDAFIGKLVSGGQITLDTAASKVHVGLPFNSDFLGLRQALPSQEGESESNLGRVDHIVLRLYATSGGLLGPDLETLEDISEDLVAHDQLTDTVINLFSGDIEIPVHGAWDTTGRIAIRQDKPLPMTILAVGTRLQKAQRGNRAR